MSAKRNLLFLFLASYFNSEMIFAQNVIDDESDSLSAEVGLKTNTLNLELQHRNQAATNLIYKPNTGTQQFVGLRYGFIGGSIGLSEPISDYSHESHGRSQAEDYQLRFFGKHWTPELFYQSYSGYYLENTQGSGTAANSGTNYLRPDVRARHVGAQVFYNFSPDEYSFSGHFSLKSRQLESAGSWFLIGSLSQYEITADSPLTPSQINNYGSLQNATHINTTSLNLGGAYAHNFIYKNYFIGGLLGVSLNYQVTEGSGTNSNYSKDALSGNRFYVKAAAGYNGNRLYYGVSLNVDGQAVEYDQARMILDTSEAKLFIGWRFDDPKISWLKSINTTISQLIKN